MTITNHISLSISLLHCSSEEYCDCSIRVFRSDCSIRVYRSFKQVFRGASWGPFQAGARGKIPQLPSTCGRPCLPTLSPVTITRSNHEQKFLHYHTSIDNYKYSFFPRTIPEWNGLPQDIINQQTIDSFKQLLYNHF